MIPSDSYLNRMNPELEKELNKIGLLTAVHHMMAKYGAYCCEIESDKKIGRYIKKTVKQSIKEYQTQINQK